MNIYLFNNKLSNLNHKKITYQQIVNGKLITKFDEDENKGIRYHPAGCLVCEPWTNDDTEHYKRLYGTSDGILGETVTRLGVLWHDHGVLHDE